jgi:quercetin dioxygenase-like cupin family protein
MPSEQTNKSGGNFIIKQTIRIFTVLSIILLLQTGCSMVRNSQGTSGASTVVKELAKTSQSWNGEYLPVYPQGRPQITMLRISIPAGARLDIHSHPVINAGVLLSGELTVLTKDGKTLYLKAGDPIVEVVNTLHYGINQGNVPAEIIVFYAGTIDMPITVVEPQ